MNEGRSANRPPPAGAMPRRLAGTGEGRRTSYLSTVFTGCRSILRGARATVARSWSEE
jgi:hypothetical protein